MTARTVSQMLKAASASLQGKTRGPDHDPEGKRRVPHRDSYEAGRDPRASPWKPIGDGSVAQGLAYRDGLIQAAKEYYHQLWKDYPLACVRDARARYAELSSELDRYAAGEPFAIGRPAIARRELGVALAYLKEAEHRLRRVDVTVLEALLKNLDFATGRLFPAIETIAAWAGCHRNSVIKALERLRFHGFVAWVRRTVRTGNDNQFAPQREQTSNAYYFDHRRKMKSGVFERYWQIVVSKLRRLGAVPAALRAKGPREVQDPAFRAVLASVGAAVAAREAGPPLSESAST